MKIQLTEFYSCFHIQNVKITACVNKHVESFSHEINKLWFNELMKTKKQQLSCYSQVSKSNYNT